MTLPSDALISSQPVSIGVITQEHRIDGLGKLLEHLKPVIEQHEYPVEIVIANNSGRQANTLISDCLERSQIGELCDIKLIDSPQNNIATGRNLLLDHSSYSLLAFLDDDEYPCRLWLKHLLDVMERCKAPVVAGPVPAVFHASAPRWVCTVDLHNTRGKIDARQIDITGTGNVLFNKHDIGDLRFDEKFGKSGGSDTDFFLRFKQRGGTLYWAKEAVAFEDIPEERSTARFLIHRFIKQGENFRKINTAKGAIRSQLLYSVKSGAMVFISLPIAFALVALRHPRAGDWMKRAFSNYGKLHSPNKQLYEH